MKTHILCLIMFFFFFRKPCRLWDNVEKPGGAREATNYVTIWRIHVACWISKATRTRTQMCNTYCFSTATMVSLKCLNVTLYVHCLSCYVINMVAEFYIYRNLCCTKLFWSTNKMFFWNLSEKMDSLYARFFSVQQIRLNKCVLAPEGRELELLLCRVV